MKNEGVRMWTVGAVIEVGKQDDGKGARRRRNDSLELYVVAFFIIVFKIRLDVRAHIRG